MSEGRWVENDVGWFGLRRGWVLIIFWTAVLAIAIVLRAVGVFGPNTFF